MKTVVCVQVFVFFVSLAGMLAFAMLYGKLRGMTRRVRLRNFASKAYDACVSVLVADSIMALLTLSICVIVFMFS